MKATPKLYRNTPAEDAEIQRGIDADPDTYEFTDADAAHVAPLAVVLKRTRGRPKQAVTKERVTMRLDADIVDFFRATGEGWQTRINETLRLAMETAK